MKRTKIICTIGPASESEEVLTSLIKAGMNVMRLNFSHGDYEEHLAKVKTLRKINKKLGTNVAFMLDTKGPEIRTGVFAGDEKVKQKFKKGNKLTITTRDVMQTEDLISVTYKGLPKDVEVGGHILIDDGLLDLLIKNIKGTEIECEILNDAEIKGKRGVNVPNAKLKLSAMTEKDKQDFKFAVDNDFDFIAASFIRKAKDVLDIKKYLKELGGERIKIISKIENQEGLDNFDEILKVTDGVMVARGDLGVEIPEEEVPVAQKMMIKKTVAAGKTVITATQMLESMQHNPRATRAEISDVANAIYDGTSCIMLSGESAQGDYPLEAVKTMAKVAERIEKDVNHWYRFKKNNIQRISAEEVHHTEDFGRDTSFSVCSSAMFSDAKAIVIVTNDGQTVSTLSSFKPGCQIFAITSDEKTCRQMAIEYDVHCVCIPSGTTFNTLLSKGIEKLKADKLLKEGDTVVLSGKDKISKDTALGMIMKI